MTHSELIHGNVLVADGCLAGLLDCGGFAKDRLRGAGRSDR
jgi:hypothetical protein